MRYPTTQRRRSVSWVLAFWLSVSQMLVIYSTHLKLSYHFTISILTADTVRILLSIRLRPYLSTSVLLLPSWVSRKISCIHLPTGTAWPTATSPLSFSFISHRAAWFVGIGRTRYYYGKPRSEIHVGFKPLNGEFTGLPNNYSRRASSLRSQIKISTVHSMFISCCSLVIQGYQSWEVHAQPARMRAIQDLTSFISKVFWLFRIMCSIQWHAIIWIKIQLWKQNTLIYPILSYPYLESPKCLQQWRGSMLFQYVIVLLGISLIISGVGRRLSQVIFMTCFFFVAWNFRLGRTAPLSEITPAWKSIKIIKLSVNVPHAAPACLVDRSVGRERSFSDRTSEIQANKTNKTKQSWHGLGSLQQFTNIFFVVESKNQIE
jgi:hypothetical protein